MFLAPALQTTSLSLDEIGGTFMKTQHFAKVLAAVAVISALAGVASAAMMIKNAMPPAPTSFTNTTMPTMNK